MELASPGTIVLVCPASFVYNFAYYADPALFRDVKELKDPYHLFTKLREKGVYVINDIRNADIKGEERIIYLDAAASFSAPQNGIVEFLEKDYHIGRTYHSEEIFNISEWSRREILIHR